MVCLLLLEYQRHRACSNCLIPSLSSISILLIISNIFSVDICYGKQLTRIVSKKIAVLLSTCTIFSTSSLSHTEHIISKFKQDTTMIHWAQNLLTLCIFLAQFSTLFVALRFKQHFTTINENFTDSSFPPKVKETHSCNQAPTTIAATEIAE